MAHQLRECNIELNGQNFTVQVNRPVVMPSHCPRLAVVSYLPNQLARQILRVCIQTIMRFTPEPHELWVIDNNSSLEYVDWLLRLPNVNVVLNRTEPVPPRNRGFFRQVVGTLRGEHTQQQWGSYANAVALELAAHLIDPQSHYLMTLHMDAMPCRVGWLTFLQLKLDDTVAAAGVRLDKVRTPEGVLHILGCLINFQLFKQLNLDFWPHLPQYDVGDRVTVALRTAGYDVFSCRNTIWKPDLTEAISISSPLRSLHVDRAFDDDGNVIFLHLGRGIKKSSIGHDTGITPEKWIEFADRHLLA